MEDSLPSSGTHSPYHQRRVREFRPGVNVAMRRENLLRMSRGQFRDQDPVAPLFLRLEKSTIRCREEFHCLLYLTSWTTEVRCTAARTRFSTMAS
jgi:hypothetical protein